MTYRVVWRLIGHHERLLDGGGIEDAYINYAAAAAAVSELLSAYPEAVRSECGTYWRARRSADADLEIRIWIENVATADVVAAAEF